MERLGRSAARAGAAPEVDDEREADVHDPCCSFEMKQLFEEFHMLYQERLRQLEIMDDTQEEVLRMKVRLLQSYVIDLSDQNSVLGQKMEELERESEWKVATLEAELQRPSLAQRPMPTEHLSGSTAAQITVTPPQQLMEQEELRVQLASKEQLIHQLNVHLREANHSQEKSKAEILEKETKIRELQEIITDLHHEISLKDLEAVNQLEEKHLLETTVQSLRQMLDAQEQRIYQLQTKQTERQAELEQKCSQMQQLERDLEASGRLQEESQRQLGECNARLAQVAGENEALRGHQLEQMLEAQETKNQLAEAEVEMVTMRSKYSMAQKEMSQQHRTIRTLEEKQAHLQAHCHHLEEETGFLHARLEVQGLALENEQTLVTSQVRHKEEQVATLTGKLLKAKAEAQAAEQQAGQLEALLSTSQLESCSLKKDLRRKDEELQCLQEQLWDSREALQDARQGKEAIQESSETQLLQRDQLVEQQKADLVAARLELSRYAGQLAELRADQQQQAGELAVLRERHKTAQQEVCSRDQIIGKLRGDLKSAEEQLMRAKDEGKERAAEGSGLKGKLHQLQDDIRSLQEICGEREKAMVEQTCCIQQLQHEQEICISQSQQQAMLVEQMQGELTSRERAHQTELEQLRAKLQHLQQELDVCKGKNQDNLSHLQQRESTMERQSSHLEFLLQQCQTLKEEVFYYEEVVQKQDRELCLQQEQLREAQEHLAMAKSKSSSTESSLDLYKKKYQAALNRAGELEGKVQSLEEELWDMSSQMWECDDIIINLCSKQLVLQQEMTGRRKQTAVEQLTQELHATQEDLDRSLQHTPQHEQSIQALREQLAASQTKCLEADKTLIDVQTEFASYTATHSHSNASYESQVAMAENLQQQLSHADEDRAKHSQRAEEYQCLVQDLKLELVRVAEQKNSSMKAVGTLELEVQNLRQDTAAKVERKQLEVAKLQQLIQQLECELRESRRLCAQKEQIMQRRDEQLRQAQAAMRQAHGALQQKELKLEKQRAEARSLAARLQQAQQEREQSQAASDSLQEEIQLLRQSLQDSQQQQQAAGSCWSA
ncbi:trichohyalin-like isoform X2 [Gopherus evgoodei]|uniref:trichohyalin-like isoform X2 n=1 Tax=Gopherus evgoodei TaxID=1825980 RepID=UPI0011CF96A7|nr:trichohyalin-like isoform X2 [Gopherus evgoodei]